jgi:hypothetical protein
MMDIFVSMLAVLVAVSCLVALLVSDVQDRRKKVPVNKEQAVRYHRSLQRKQP